MQRNIIITFTNGNGWVERVFHACCLCQFYFRSCICGHLEVSLEVLLTLITLASLLGVRLAVDWSRLCDWSDSIRLASACPLVMAEVQGGAKSAPEPISNLCLQPIF